MKKSFVVVILALVLAAALGVGGCFVAVYLQGLSYDIDSIEKVGTVVEVVGESEDSVTIKKNDDSDFKVLMFTDTHLNGKEDTDYTAVSYLVENISKEKPDLVIYGGDNVSSGFNMRRYVQFADLMENLGVYWVAVLGNHESEGIFTYSRKKIVDLFSSYDYCLIKNGRTDIDGYGNFTVNILNPDNSIKEVIYLMDSGNYMTKELKEKYGVEQKGQVYDGVKESQVQWYKEKHDALTEEFGEFKSFTVIHIPPYECRSFGEDEEYLYGDKREGMCPAGFNSGIFDAMKEKGSAQAVYYGHDHMNDYGVMYDGILLSYIQSAGYSSYNMGNSRNAPESEWVQGYTKLEIKADGTYDAYQCFNHK